MEKTWKAQLLAAAIWVTRMGYIPQELQRIFAPMQYTLSENYHYWPTHNFDDNMLQAIKTISANTTINNYSISDLFRTELHECVYT